MWPLMVLPPSGELIAERRDHFSVGSKAKPITWQGPARAPDLI